MTEQTLPSKMPSSDFLRLSPSKLNLWKACRRHAQVKVLNEPFVDRQSIHGLTGQAIHAVLEAINKGQQLDSKQRDTLLREELTKRCIASGVDLEFVKAYKESKTLLRGYEIPTGWKLLSAEKKHVVQVPEKGFEFAYIVDLTLLRVDNEFIRFIDYKSSAAAPSSGLQLISNAWAEGRRLDELAKSKGPSAEPISRDHMSAAFWMTRNNKLVEVEVSAKIIADFEAWLFASVDLMRATWKAGLDMPATGGDCRYCPLEGCTERK